MQLDANRNGQLYHSGEPYTVTDVNGHYAFYGLQIRQDHVIGAGNFAGRVAANARWPGATLRRPLRRVRRRQQLCPGPITVYNGAMYFSANGGDGAKV